MMLMATKRERNASGDRCAAAPKRDLDVGFSRSQTKDGSVRETRKDWLSAHSQGNLSLVSLRRQSLKE